MSELTLHLCKLVFWITYVSQLTFLPEEKLGENEKISVFMKLLGEQEVTSEAALSVVKPFS